jgi:translation initiation factor eIF-2B subunit delta
VDAAAILDEIRRDNRSGATALLRRAGDALRCAADIHETARAVASVRPPFGGLVTLASAALHALDAASDPSDARRRISEAVDVLLARATADADDVVRQAARALPLSHVLTISASSLVERTILAAVATTPLAAICLESRPAREGAALAERLAEAGCTVTLAVDAAGPALVAEASAVLLGCDTLAPGGLVHKIGTFGLALAARQFGVPVYALAGPEKLLPALVRGALADGGPPEEIVWARPPALAVSNRYFDLTPLDLLTGVVPPDGILDPAEAGRRAAARPVHPALADLLEH